MGTLLSHEKALGWADQKPGPSGGRVTLTAHHDAFPGGQSKAPKPRQRREESCSALVGVTLNARSRGVKVYSPSV